MSINISQRAGFAAELRQTIGMSTTLIGTLVQTPVIIIFDNQGSNNASISTDGGSTTWKTFTAGEAVVLDLRAAHGLAANFGFDVGTTFHATGTNGDAFSISYIYARN